MAYIRFVVPELHAQSKRPLGIVQKGYRLLRAGEFTDEEAAWFNAITRWLDENLELTGRGNYEILVEWLTFAAASDYEPVFERVREVLLRVGRMKYLRPLYKALGGHPRTQALAREVYAAASPGYHELSRRVTEAVMDEYDE